MSGLFISLDGLDGTGKSTQCQLLASWFRQLGLTVVTCNDPGGTELGNKLREILLFGRANDISLRTESMLFLASRAELVASVIQPALDRGEVVISDRFMLASIVYQGYAGGLNPDAVRMASLYASNGIEPDATIVLDMDLDSAKARLNRPADRMESKGDEYFNKVRAGFLTEAKRWPTKIGVVNASGTLDEVQLQIRNELNRLLPGLRK